MDGAVEIGRNPVSKQQIFKNMNASRPSEHPHPVGGESSLSKRKGGKIMGCKDINSGT